MSAPRKRFRQRKYRDGVLAVYYGKVPHDSPDVIIQRGPGVPRCDGAYIYCALCTERMRFAYGDENKSGRGYTFDKSFIDELKDRGYDITSIEFSIKKLPKDPTHAD